MAWSMLQRNHKSLIVAGIIFWLLFSPLWMLVVFVDPDPSARRSDFVCPIFGAFSTVALVAFAGYGLWKWSRLPVETQSLIP